MAGRVKGLTLGQDAARSLGRNRLGVDVDVSRLTNLTLSELALLWRRHLTGPMPDHLPKSVLTSLVAYRLQEVRIGGLSKRSAAYLKVIEIDLREGREPQTPYRESGTLRAGTQLAREHGGVLHRVIVEEHGFEWAGQNYSSLSAVAKAITGTNWNGHRFFGLQSGSGAGLKLRLSKATSSEKGPNERAVTGTEEQAQPTKTLAEVAR
jgi:hypothetical protein